MSRFTLCRTQRTVLGALLFALVTVVSTTSFAAGFGADDRLPRVREKGTLYGAIGLMVHSNGIESEAGTAFLVSPCHVMTAYHVVAGKAMAADLKDGESVKTVNGKDLTPAISGGKVMVGNANVVKADVSASNGVIHVIDAVLIP